MPFARLKHLTQVRLGVPRLLVAGFGFTLLGLIASIALYFTALLSVMRSTEALVFDDVDDLVAITNLKFVAERKVAQDRAFLLTNNAKFLSEARASHQSFNEANARLVNKLQSSTGRHLLEEVRRAENLHQEEFEGIVTQVQAPHTPVAVALLFEQRLKPKRDQLDAAFAKLLYYEKAQVDLGKARSRSGDRWSLALTAAGSVLSLVVFAAFAVVVWLTVRRLQEIDRLRQLSHAAAVSSKQLFETVLEQLPVAVIIAEAPSGRLLFANNKMEEVWGHKVLPSRGLADYAAWKGFHGDGRPYKAEDWPLARALLHGEVTLNEETRIERGDGSPGLLRLTSAPVRSEKGQIFAAVVICEDHAQRKRMEEERIELLGRERAAQSASELKSMFLANMSHEVRTPLNGILGMAALLRDTPLQKSQLELVDDLNFSAEALLGVINDILDFSKVEAGKLELEAIAFDLEELLRRVEKFFAHQAKRKQLSFRMQHALGAKLWYRGDPGRVRQILLNLVSNALKFTLAGSVEVQASLVSTAEGIATLRFCVKDTGPGIEAETLARLFVPFGQADASTSRKFGGTGLGLSICKHLVSLMGGEIGVESTPQQGSLFWFTLPLPVVITDAMPQTPLSLSQQAGPIKGRVLVVEDNLTNQKIARLMLEKMGHQVVLANNGYEGLTALKLRQFDLILMDCQMPELDGYETTRLIRQDPEERLRQLPIIAMTASSIKGDQERCLATGMNDYISKPFQASDLAALVHRWLTRVKSQAAAPTPDPRVAQSIDYSMLDALREIGGDSQPQFVNELITTFLEMVPARMGVMEEALRTGSAQGIQRAAHSLTAAAGSLGAAKFAGYCQELELLPAEQCLAEAPALIALLASEFTTVTKVFTAMLPEQSKAA